MNMRAFASTLAVNGSWLGLVVLFPMAAGLLAAAVWSEAGQALFGLAGLTCAACADPSNGISTAAAAAGTAAAGAAAGGAAAGTGGPSRRTNPRFSDPAYNPRLPGPEDDVGDATSPHQQLENAGAASGPPGGPMIRVSRQIERWVELWTGTDIIGTVPAGGRA